MWLIILYVLMTSAGLVTLKLGSQQGALVELSHGKPVVHLTPLNVLGIFLYGLSFILYVSLIAKNDLGFIIPFTTALIYSMVFLASFVVFKEQFTLRKIGGILLILIGVIILSMKR